MASNKKLNDMSKETEVRSALVGIGGASVTTTRIHVLEELWDNAIDKAIELVQKDYDESLNWSISNTFASQHLKALIPKLNQLKK